MIIPTPFTRNGRRYYLRIEWTLSKPRLPRTVTGNSGPGVELPEKDTKTGDNQ